MTGLAIRPATKVLRLFARVTRASTRLNDIIGRFGGEEFIAIVPGGHRGRSENSLSACRTAFENAGGRD
jgi:diguanylate cyclase (GGDEF)-like protein